jgi:hypothetical protein
MQHRLSVNTSPEKYIETASIGLDQKKRQRSASRPRFSACCSPFRRSPVLRGLFGHRRVRFLLSGKPAIAWMYPARFLRIKDQLTSACIPSRISKSLRSSWTGELHSFSWYSVECWLASSQAHRFGIIVSPITSGWQARSGGIKRLSSTSSSTSSSSGRLSSPVPLPDK